MIDQTEPEGWRAECWPALYQPVLLVGVPWRLAVGQFMCGWVPFGFATGHPFVAVLMAILTHWGLKKLHDGDPEFLAIAWRSLWIRRHWRV